MLRSVLAIAFSVVVAAPALAGDGMVHVRSPYNVEETVERFVDIVQSKGLTLFAQIDHSAGAKKVQHELPPTTLVIFGNPKVGTPLMQCGRTVAIDLPQKMLIWEDVPGKVWVSYNDPSHLAARHQLHECGDVVTKIQKALANLVAATTSVNNSAGSTGRVFVSGDS